MVEIHRELWGKRSLLGKIFRAATVTKDDYAQLQSLLDAQHPERKSDDYVSQDVLATKAGFLQDKKTDLDIKVVEDGLVPRPVLACQPPSPDIMNEDGVVGDGDVVDDDDDDVVMDDDAAMVIDNAHLPNEAMAIFPYTFQYVDLTFLHLKQALRVPHLMLFRKEWGTMIDIFNKRRKGRKGSAIFSGQPGIGEHHYWYLTVTSNQRPRENMHVAFHLHSLPRFRPAIRVSGRVQQRLYDWYCRAPSGHTGDI